MEETSVDSMLVKDFIHNSPTPTTSEEGNCRSRPKIDFADIDGVGSTNSVKEYKVRSKFLDYQEGKPFFSEHNSRNAILDFQVRKVTNDEEDNINQFTSYISQILKVLSSLHVSPITSNCVGLPSSDSGTMLFDRGKCLEAIRRYSYYVRSNSEFNGKYVYMLVLQQGWNSSGNRDYSLTQLIMDKVNYELLANECLFLIFDSSRKVFDRGKGFQMIMGYFYSAIDYECCFDTITSGLIVHIVSISMDEHSKNSVYELILELGYGLELLFVHPNVFVFIKNGDNHDARKLSGKIFQQVILPWTNGVLLVTRKNKPENTQELFEQLLVRDFRLSTHMEEDWKEFMEQEIITINNTMLLAWKLNLLQLNPWVCLPEIELFIFFLPGEYEKKMHGSVVQSLSEDAYSLLWRLSSGLSIGIKLLHVGSMKTSFNARAKRDISKIPVGSLRASELFSQEWLEVLTPEDNFVRRHGYSLMVTLLAVGSYCQLLKVSFFFPSPFHISIMNDDQNTRTKFMKATMIPGLFVLNTFEDTWKIVRLKRGCRVVACWVRKVKIKEMLANDSVGETSRHEWLEEMLMGVNGSFIQLGVAGLKLTVMETQICSLIEYNGVVCDVILGISRLLLKTVLKEFTYAVARAISSMIFIESVYLYSVIDSILEFGIDSSDIKIDFRWDINVFDSGSSVAVERWNLTNFLSGCVIRSKTCECTAQFGCFIRNNQQVWMQLKPSTSNGTAPKGKEETINSMLTNQFQKLSYHRATTASNSVRYHITRVSMLEPWEVKVILVTALCNISTDSSTGFSFSRGCWQQLFVTIRIKSLDKDIVLAVEYLIVNNQQNLKQLQLSKSTDIATKGKEMAVDSMLPANTSQESSTHIPISAHDSVEGHIGRFIMHKLELNTSSVEKEKFYVLEGNLKIHVDDLTGSEVRVLILRGAYTVYNYFGFVTHG